jgi:3-phenylpropionate/cinnamic acid dioxygenase small subunit
MRCERDLSVHERRSLAEDLIYTGISFLDERNWSAWLSLTTPSFQYRIGAYSPEIRKEMTWLEHDREGLNALFSLLGKHHLDHALWFRQATLQRVTQESEDTLRAVTQFVIYQTSVDVGDVHVESGSTKLFAVGRYYDQIIWSGERWLLADRYVQLDTRQLGIGSHDIV